MGRRPKEAEITVGADPEVFLVERTNRQLVAACGLIGGTKMYPAPMGKEGFFVQEDNVALEFNIPPAKSRQEFEKSISWALEEIRATLATINLEPRIVGNASFSERELAKPGASSFGCTPDFDAWNNGQPIPLPREIPTGLRTCGGHVHIGYPTNYVNPLVLIQACDLFLGIPALPFESSLRRQLYGKAGAYRPTKYGVEYRVLSNWWLRAPIFVSWVYDSVFAALKFARSPEAADILWALRDDIKTRINTGGNITTALAQTMATLGIKGVSRDC